MVLLKTRYGFVYRLSTTRRVFSKSFPTVVGGLDTFGRIAIDVYRQGFRLCRVFKSQQNDNATRETLCVYYTGTDAQNHYYYNSEVLGELFVLNADETLRPPCARARAVWQVVSNTNGRVVCARRTTIKVVFALILLWLRRVRRVWWITPARDGGVIIIRRWRHFAVVRSV